MDNSLNHLADQAGTMTAGLGIILDKLAAAEHKITDLRAGGIGLTAPELADLLDLADDLAQLADYVADLRARTAPTPPDGGTPRSRRRIEQAEREAQELAMRMGSHWAAGMYG